MSEEFICPSPLALANGTSNPEATAIYAYEPGNCAVPCPSIEYTSGEWNTITNIVTVLTMMSCFLSLYSFLCHLVEYRKYYIRLMFISGFFFNSCVLTIFFIANRNNDLICDTAGYYVEKGSPLCIFQAGSLIFSFIWVECWSVIFAIDMYLHITSYISASDIPKMLTIYTCVASVVSFTITAIPLIASNLGYDPQSNVPFCLYMISENDTYYWYTFLLPLVFLILAALFYGVLCTLKMNEIFVLNQMKGKSPDVVLRVSEPAVPYFDGDDSVAILGANIVGSSYISYGNECGPVVAPLPPNSPVSSRNEGEDVDGLPVPSPPKGSPPQRHRNSTLDDYDPDFIEYEDDGFGHDPTIENCSRRYTEEDDFDLSMSHSSFSSGGGSASSGPHDGVHSDGGYYNSYSILSTVSNVMPLASNAGKCNFFGDFDTSMRDDGMRPLLAECASNADNIDGASGVSATNSGGGDSRHKSTNSSNQFTSYAYLSSWGPYLKATWKYNGLSILFVLSFCATTLCIAPMLFYLYYVTFDRNVSSGEEFAACLVQASLESDSQGIEQNQLAVDAYCEEKCGRVPSDRPNQGLLFTVLIWVSAYGIIPALIFGDAGNKFKLKVFFQSLCCTFGSSENEM